MSLTRDAVFWNAFSSHSDKTVRAARALLEMLERPGESERLARDITTLESEGDQITHDTVLALHQTWITPLDREEIHALISRLDDVLDYIDSASDRIALYEVREIRPEAIDLAKILLVAAQEIEKATQLLRDMKDAKVLLSLCRDINKREHEADGVFRKGLARLFKDGTDPLEVMKWRDIFESLETATDRAEDVANIVEGIVLEHA